MDLRAAVLRDIRTTLAGAYPQAHVPASVDEALAGVLPTGWVRAEHALALLDAVAAVHPDAPYELGRLSAHASTGAPLFRAMRAQLARLFALRPSSVLRWYPGGWALAMRGAGAATFRDGVEGGCIEYVDAPRELFTHAAFRASVVGSLVGIVEHVGWLAEVVPSPHLAQVHLRWWRAAPRCAVPAP